MRKLRLVKKVSKGLLSVLLVLSVMLSLIVPFAAEDAETATTAADADTAAAVEDNSDVTEGEDEDNKNEKLDARSYLRYTDANGKMRVFYNDYKKNQYYGGCLCSYNPVQTMAIKSSEPQEETHP